MNQKHAINLSDFLCKIFVDFPEKFSGLKVLIGKISVNYECEVMCDFVTNVLQRIICNDKLF
jgi:hypothetical protein